MAQFSVYANKSATTKARFPYLLDVQSDLLSELETRVVIPLCPQRGMKGKPFTVLMPIVDIAGKPHILITPQLAGIAKKELGTAVADLGAYRSAIVAALDLLVAGV